MPQRIQRKRTKGWKMPEGAVYVGRPTIFGNPYDVKRYGLDLSLALFSETARGCWNPMLIPEGPHEIQWSECLYGDHLDWLRRINHRPVEMIRAMLCGKDLACWCRLFDERGNPVPCHADILLEIANAD